MSLPFRAFIETEINGLCQNCLMKNDNGMCIQPKNDFAEFILNKSKKFRIVFDTNDKN